MVELFMCQKFICSSLFVSGSRHLFISRLIANRTFCANGEIKISLKHMFILPALEIS